MSLPAGFTDKIKFKKTTQHLKPITKENQEKTKAMFGSLCDLILTLSICQSRELKWINRLLNNILPRLPY
jgi:hypothetical protein